MPGLVPGIHVLTFTEARKTWMAGSSARRRASRFGPAMTKRATALRILSKRLSTVVPATEPGPVSTGDVAQQACVRSPPWPNERNYCVASSASDLPVGLPSRKPVQPLLQKYSAFPKSQISLYQPRPAPERGALAIVTNVGAGCGGRGSVRRAWNRRAGFP
jgi:hypothetical protein